MATASVVDNSSVSVSSRRLTQKTWTLTVIVVLAQVFGNLSLNWGMKHQTLELGLSPLAYIETIFTPWVAVGIAVLILWLLTRMTLLSWADLSFVLPVTSIGYVLTALVGKYFFQEQISWQRWLGTAFIVAGIAIVGRTQPNTTATQPVRRSR